MKYMAYTCSDNKYRTVTQIMKELSPFSEYGQVFEYKDHKYVIQFYNNNALNGYVIYSDTMIENIEYDPHGGITGGYRNPILNIEGTGFDCGHYDDITMDAIKHKYVSDDMTFKMPSFVHDECKKMIDSLYT